jgi:hypothetical protein
VNPKTFQDSKTQLKMNRTSKKPRFCVFKLASNQRKMLYFIANYLEIKSKGDAKP